MKKCPFCAEEIQDAAIKCRHCGEFLDRTARATKPKEDSPWYFKPTFIVLAFCGVGPLALPLIWWHPKLSRTWKIGLTIGILVLSWVIFHVTMKSIDAIREYYKFLDTL